MKFLKTKFMLALTTVATLLCSTSCQSKPLRVKYGESHSLRELTHVHESPVTWISVGPKKYDNVMGGEPYYVQIPGRSEILFITSNPLQSEFVYHFVSLETGKEVAIATQYTSLWMHLSPASGKGKVTFESMDGPHIAIVSHWEKQWSRYQFDLDRKTVTESKGSEPKTP